MLKETRYQSDFIFLKSFMLSYTDLEKQDNDIYQAIIGEQQRQIA